MSYARKVRRAQDKSNHREHAKLKTEFWVLQGQFKNLQQVVANQYQLYQGLTTERDALQAFTNLFAEALAVAVYTSPEGEIKASPLVREAAKEYFVIDEGVNGALHLVLKKKETADVSEDD